MTKAIHIEELARALPPSQFAIIRALRRLWPDGRLVMLEGQRLASPVIDSAEDLARLQAQGDQLPRLGRCDWLDNLDPAPESGPLTAAQHWLALAVAAVNAGLTAQDQMLADTPDRDRPAKT